MSNFAVHLDQETGYRSFGSRWVADLENSTCEFRDIMDAFEETSQP